MEHVIKTIDALNEIKASCLKEMARAATLPAANSKERYLCAAVRDVLRREAPRSANSLKRFSRRAA